MKIKNKKHVCKYCNKEYFSADIKGNYCYECKELKKECECGCKTVMMGAHKNYVNGHGVKGKTYKEIYGTKKVKCGYQKGKDNIAKKPSIRKKISEGVIKSYTPNLRKLRSEQSRKSILNGRIIGKMKYTNSDGEKFRSMLEINFCSFLKKESFKYQYEKRIRMIDNRLKIIDFIVNDIFIEITGLAHKNWVNDFISKIISLSKTIKQQILVLTYPECIEKVKFLESEQITILSIYDLQKIKLKLNGN